MSYLSSAFQRDYSHWFRKWKRRSLSKVKCSGIPSYTFSICAPASWNVKRKHSSFCIFIEHLQHLWKQSIFHTLFFFQKICQIGCVALSWVVFVQSSHNGSLKNAIVLHLGIDSINVIECKTKSESQILCLCVDFALIRTSAWSKWDSRVVPSREQKHFPQNTKSAKFSLRKRVTFEVSTTENWPQLQCTILW